MLSARRHTVENAKTVRLVGDRNIGDFILEAFAVALNMSTHFCASPCRLLSSGREIRPADE
jgi:hypothetical protein